jgi:hypothetical protein
MKFFKSPAIITLCLVINFQNYTSDHKCHESNYNFPLFGSKQPLTNLERDYYIAEFFLNFLQNADEIFGSKYHPEKPVAGTPEKPVVAGKTVYFDAERLKFNDDPKGIYGDVMRIFFNETLPDIFKNLFHNNLRLLKFKAPRSEGKLNFMALKPPTRLAFRFRNELIRLLPSLLAENINTQSKFDFLPSFVVTLIYYLNMMLDGTQYFMSIDELDNITNVSTNLKTHTIFKSFACLDKDRDWFNIYYDSIIDFSENNQDKINLLMLKVPETIKNLRQDVGQITKKYLSFRPSQKLTQE